jgi:hypothetical protein
MTLLQANSRLFSAGGNLLTVASQYQAFGATTPWQAHYNRVRGTGGAAAAATVDLAFVQRYFEQQQALGLQVLADLSPRFGYALTSSGRVLRLYEPQGKDLVPPPGYVGPTVTTSNGHSVLDFDGNALLTSEREGEYDLLGGDLVSYTYAKTTDTNATASVYSKAIANDQPDRYSLIYEAGSLYSLFANRLQHNAGATAMPPGAWRELGQRVRRQVASNELLVSRQPVATTGFAVEADDFDSVYAFALGGYSIGSNASGDTFGFFFSGQIDRLRLLRSWPGAAADTTIWNTLIS